MPDTAPTLVDVHAHFVTEEYIAAAKAAGHVYPDGTPGWPSWDPETHLRLMDRWGIRTSMLSISSPGIHFGDDKAARALARSVNEYGAAVAAAHPARFGHFACLPFPDVEGSLTELAYALDRLGSDGVAVTTNARFLLKRDRGGPTVQDQIRRLWFDMAVSPFPNQIPALVKAFGDERLLFGSDYCWAPVDFVDRHLASMDGAEQPEGETWRTLTTRNAAHLLPRGTDAQACARR
ncbi:MAG TPA: amidohydrolase family protein [Trebonia sp.]|nr:amidohydrolase family protein [Trebonia sp.]